MKFERLLKALNWALLSTSLVAGTASAATLKLGHVTPPSHVWHKVAEKIDENLQAKTKGDLKLNISPLSKLGTEAQMINLLQSGAMQIGILNAGVLANREPSLFAWSLPYIFKDVEHATKAVETPAAQQMLKNLEQNGMLGVGYAFAGMRHVVSTKPITSPDDLVNKKVRAFPNAIYNDFWNAFKAAPTAMPLSEVAPSLTTNLLDAVDIDLDALVGMKVHQQAPYLTLTNHMAFPAVIVVSKRYFDRLDAEQQKILLEAIHEAEKWGFAEAIKAEVANLEQAKKDDVKLQTLNLEPFERVGKTILEKYTQDNELRASFLEQVKAIQ